MSCPQNKRNFNSLRQWCKNHLLQRPSAEKCRRVESILDKTAHWSINLYATLLVCHLHEMWQYYGFWECFMSHIFSVPVRPVEVTDNMVLIGVQSKGEDCKSSFILFCQKPNADAPSCRCWCCCVSMINFNFDLHGCFQSRSNNTVVGGSDTNQHSLNKRRSFGSHFWIYTGDRQSFLSWLTYWHFILALHLNCIPQHGDFPRLKATWRPARRHLRECVVTWNRWSQMRTEHSAGERESPLLPSLISLSSPEDFKTQQKLN